VSPVAPSNNHVGRAALVALVGVVVLFLGVGLATFALRNKNSPDLRLGDQTFQAGTTKDRASEIARHGPFLLGDVSGRKDRDLILQHVGTNPNTGWSAFLAAPLNKPRDCTWVWRPATHDFVAKCDPHLTAPADGAGLPQFQVTITDGRLSVNLNADAKTTPKATRSTTTTGSSTTTGG